MEEKSYSFTPQSMESPSPPSDHLYENFPRIPPGAQTSLCTNRKWRGGISIALDLSSFSAISTILFELAKEYGYLGVFVYALVGSLIPFVPLPYLAAAVFLAPVLNPLLIGIAAGVGGSLGKITSYYLGRGGYFLSGEKSRKNVELFRHLTDKYGDIIVFIFAATPLPDDIYIVPAGLMKFPFWRFLLANTAGKIVLATLTAYLSRTYFSIASQLLGENSIIVIAAAVVATLVLTILMIKADWQRGIEIYKLEGWKGLLRHLPGILIPVGRKRDESVHQSP